MSLHTSITTIMTSDIITIAPNEPLSEAERILLSGSFKHLPVVKNKKLVGIITKTDIKRMSFANTFDEFEADADAAVIQMLTVDQIMTTKPFTMPKTATVKDVAEVLSKKEFRSIPIMDGDILLGIVTTKDVIKYLVKNYPV